MRQWPTVDEVAEQLRHAQKFAEDDEDLDVRLQVYDNGAWVVRVGDAQYDTDHHGDWGAGVVTSMHAYTDLRAIAEDLLNQAKEMAEA